MKHVLPFTKCLELMGRKMVYHPRLADAVGLKESIILEQLMYWTPKTVPDADGWIFKNSAEMAEETGLTYEEQSRARKVLVELGLIEEKYSRTEHTIYFRVSRENLDAYLSEHLGNPEVSIRENLDGITAKPCSYNKESILTSEPTAIPTEVSESVSDSQPPTPQRTRTCFKCGEDIPEDDAQSHAKVCQGRRKKSRRELKSERAAKLPPVVEPFDKEREQQTADFLATYREMRGIFKRKFGKSLGSFPGGRYGEDARDLLTKNGMSKTIAGFELWCEHVNRDFIRGSSFPMSVFLKDGQDWIDDAATKPEQSESQGVIPQIRKPSWEL